MCTTDRTPTALSIHKVKMNIFVFRQRFSSPPSLPPPPPQLLGLCSDAPLPAARVGEDVCLSGAMAGAEWGVILFDGWGGGGCAVFSSFRRTTSCQSYYGSTVDTTVFPLIHTLGQQALCSVSRVGRSAELILFNNILLKLCIYLYVIVHIYNQS